MDQHKEKDRVGKGSLQVRETGSKENSEIRNPDLAGAG